MSTRSAKVLNQQPSRDVRRAKSSASVRTLRQRDSQGMSRESDNYEPHAHALTAATIAMDRAKERNRLPVDEGQSQSESSAQTSEYGVSNTEHRSDLARSQSVKSLQNSAFDQTSIPNMTTSEGIPPVPKIPSPYTRKNIQTSCLGSPMRIFGESRDSNSRSRATTPVQGLRKAKSMIFSRTPSRARGSSARRENGSSECNESPYLSRATLRRSVSFFRPRGKYSSHGGQSSSEASDAAVRLARSQFMKGFNGQEKEIRKDGNYMSSLHGCQRREPKPFRKSVRSSAESEGNGMSITSAPPSFAGMSSAPQRRNTSISRQISTSIKHGFKRILGLSPSRSSSDRRSRKSDFSSTCSDLQGGNLINFGDYVRDTGQGDYSAALDDQRHGGGQFDKGSLNRNSHSRRPVSSKSMRSSNSFATSGSRVTSWTDSTINTPGGGHSTEPNRLSIIEENGDPYRVQSPQSYHDGYSLFREPLTADSRGCSHLPVDSQAIYAALMRKIDEKRLQDRDTDGDRTPIATHINSLQRSQARGQNLSSRASLWPDDQISVVNGDHQNQRASSAHPIGLRSESGLTPQQVADYNESHARSRCNSRNGLRDARRSVFFSSSPSKRRLQTSSISQDPIPQELGQEEIQQRHKSSGTNEEDTGSVIVSRQQDQVSNDGNNTPSVYSRSASASNLFDHDDKPCHELSKSPGECGTVTILNSQILPYQHRPNLPSVAEPEKTNKTSADWKNWVDSQLADINAATDENMPDSLLRQHFREVSQIGDDNSDEDDSSELAGIIKEQRQGERHQEMTDMVRSNFSRPLYKSPVEEAVTYVDGPTRKPSIQKSPLVTPEMAVHVTQDNHLESEKTPTASQSNLPTKENAMRTPTISPLNINVTSTSPTPLGIAGSTNSPGPISIPVPPGTNRPSPSRRTLRKVQSSRFMSINRRDLAGIVNDENTPTTPANVKDNETATGRNRNLSPNQRGADYLNNMTSKQMVDKFLSERVSPERNVSEVSLKESPAFV